MRRKASCNFWTGSGAVTNRLGPPYARVIFDLPETSKVRVEVFDMLGRQVLAVNWGTIRAGASRKLTIDGSGLSSGSYLYRVTAGQAGNVRVANGRMVMVK